MGDHQPPSATEVVALYYDRSGESISAERWRELSQQGEQYTLLERTELRHATVITAWVGLDYQPQGGRDRALEIFETRLLHHASGDEKILNGYETEEAARHGHLEAVKRLVWSGFGGMERLLAVKDGDVLGEPPL